MNSIEKKITDKYIVSDFKKYERLMRAWWWFEGKFKFIPKAIASTYLVWRFPFLKFSSDKNKVFHKSCWYWLFTNYNGDPEVAVAGAGVGGSSSVGFAYCDVPATSGMTFGLNLTF